MTTVSIVIVSYNAREHLVNCLSSLAAAPPAVTHDITVVDNASSDGSPDAVQQWPSVSLIALGSNLGVAAANNAGIRQTSGNLVLLLNNDTLVPAGAIDTLVARLVAHPVAAVAGPRLVDGEGRAELSYGPMISPLGELRQKFLIGLHARRVRPVSTYVERATTREQYVDWVSGACLLVWRETAEQVGLLDERFFLYTEDVDFCAAIRRTGKKILFTPASDVVHLRGRSRAAAPQASNAAYRRSQLAFYEKHHPAWAPLLRSYLRLKGQLPPIR